MNTIFSFKYEGWNVYVKEYQYKEYLFVEDDYFGALEEFNDGQHFANERKELDIVNNFFVNPANFYKLLFAYNARELKMDHIEVWEHIYGEKVIDKIMRVIERTKEWHYYGDNLRIALKTNENDVKEYRRLASRGCCGFWSDELEIDGQVYLVGFNYGH